LVGIFYPDPLSPHKALKKYCQDKENSSHLAEWFNQSILSKPKIQALIKILFQ